MKTTKDIEKEVMGVHNLFWEYYATRDIELRFSLCSEDITFIGSGLHERALNKAEYKKINDEGVKQFPDPFQIEFLWTNLTMLNLDVACVESEVVWSQLINDKVIKELLRNTTLLKYDHDRWLVTHVHGSVPDYRLKDGDYMTNEQTIIRNRELERQVFERTQDLKGTLEELELKNRELEIESALEKVRTIAMGLRESADMLDVCKTISVQLLSLGVKEIRNVQTAIFYEQRSTYMNYKYYAKHNKTFITETVYTNNKIHNEFAAKMLKGKGETFITHIKGDEVINWIAYQKTTNVFIDKYLETASSLNYYWFSLGPVALGISTYHPLTDDEINLFKRFLNVFELAYRRYLDIEIAIAQAREAKIEAALERVRSRTMGMQKSEELKEVIRVVYEQFVHLKINVDHAGFVVDYKPKGDWQFWIADEQDIPSKIKHPYFESIWANQFNEAKEKGADFFATNLNFEEKNKFYNELLSHVPGLPKASKDFYLSCPGLAASTVLFDNVSLYIENFSGIPYTDEENNILMRFGKVFQQTYTRFLDLQKAEAQAREAKIETALERTRTQSMIMQHSKELDDTLRVFHEQVLLLGINSEFSFLWLPDEEKDRHIFWAAWGEDKNDSTVFKSKAINYPLDRNEPATAQCLVDWKSHESLFSYNVPPDAVEIYFAAWQELFEGVEQLKPEYFSGGLYYAEAFMKYGCFGVMVAADLTEDEKKILGRLAIEFERTYTRFLDLQKAEAQTREANIEISLERVRSKAMAMHSPDDLSDTVNVFFKELKTLGIVPIRCGVGQIDEATRTTSLTTTTSSQQGESFRVIGKVKQTGHPVLDGIFDHWKLQKEYHPVLKGENIKAYYNVMNPQIGYPEYPEGVTQYGNNFFFKEGFVFAWTENLLTEEELIIFRRFTSVLSLTYRRYMDLKEAEAQAKEAKIEVALERIRSRAMAMHTSDELMDVASILREQMGVLGQPELETCVVDLFDENSDQVLSWYAFRQPELASGKIVTGAARFSWQSSELTREMMMTYRSGQKEYTIEVEGAKSMEFLHVLVKVSPEILPYVGESFPDKMCYHITFFSGGALLMVSYQPPSDEAKSLQRRAALVFDMAYRRYRDLKKAEAQAREAKIEASLERVRSRTMGMQRSDELAETVSVLFKQLLDLGVKLTQLRTCGIVTFKDNEPKGEVWITDITGEIIDKAFIAPYDEAPAYKMIYSKWKQGEKFLEINLKGNDFLEHLTYVKKYSAVPNINLDEIQKSYSEIFFHVLFFSEGYLFIISYEPLPEYHDIFKRFGVLFQQTYTRFLDFKKVEAQNKIIQAENERKTKELEDARQLQLSMLPKEIPQLPHLAIAVYMKTATEVGGDYYDFNVDKDGTLTVLVGDATGHGMMSGMMVSIMKSFFISNKNNIELKQFFENANNSIKDMHLGRLMMASMGVQITSDKVIATNAGMPSLLYFRNKSKKAGEFVSNNLPLGGMKGIKYSLKEIKYEKGDTLLLMSDGLAELKNEKDEQYGYTRVKEEFMLVAQKSPNEIVEHLKSSATQWIKGIEPDDDVTFVVIKVK